MKVCLFADARAVHIQRIAAGLAARGATVTLVSHQLVDVPGVTLERFHVPEPSLTNPRRWQGRWAHYLRSFMRRYDVVQVHYLYDWGFTPEIMAEGCFLAFPWGSDIVTPPGDSVSPELHAARLAMLRNAAGVAVCGPRFAAQVAKFAGIDAASIDLLPFGVDLSLFKPTEPIKPADKDALTVGFCKGFRPVYGPTYLMQAIPIVLRALPRTRFELVGNGPLLEECQTMARESGVEANVSWLPRQPHEQMPQVLAGWDLSIISSVSEAFGVAALESSAMGVPVVATNVGGLPDTVLHGETGLLIPPRNPEQLAAGIIALLKDKPRRHQMTRSGRRMVDEQFEWQSNLDRWLPTYQAALDRRCAAV